MKYVKASDVLPPGLLDELFRYIDGCMLYIPRRPQEKRAWGENSGAKEAIRHRNACMKSAFKAGSTISALSEAYHLAEETVKKILYS